MVRACPSCGLPLERNEQGYFVGAYMFNIALAELGFVVVLIGGIAATWPNPPWRALMLASVALMLVLPVLLYPFSKTLFLGFDLLFHPHEEQPPAADSP
jgi:MFS family permease